MTYDLWFILGLSSTLLFLVGICFWGFIEDFLAGFLAMALLGSGAVIGFAFFGALTYEKQACQEYGDKLSVASTYDGNTGCWIEIDNRWINLDHYRETTQHPAVLG